MKKCWKKPLGWVLALSIFGLFTGVWNTQTLADTYNFSYQQDTAGIYLQNGVSEGNTHNYNYGKAADASFDEEGYVDYQDKAYVKKSVAETDKQGLFDVTLDVKGNQITTPVDLVLVIDYSSSMTGEKLKSALLGLKQFGDELSGALSNGNIRIGIVAYNRYLYTTDGFSTDLDYLENFLRNTAESHSGTFMQKGLMEGQHMLMKKSRPEAEKMFIHIGDDSANRSYLPAENAQEYANNGEITDYNGYHTNKYVEEFQTNSEQYYTTSSKPTDPNAIPINNTVVTDATLGTIMSIKKSGVICYSVAANPSARGEYIGRNLASDSQKYMTIDENFTGLGSALKDIANQIDKTIPNGTITDPMGTDILLQGAGNFTPENYQLQGWKKDSAGNWQQAAELLEGVIVGEQGQTLTVSGISLGKDERLTLTYQVRLNTESNTFKGETWYLCNGRTTLDPNGENELLDFPIPSIKAPTVQLKLIKKWQSVPLSLIPESIQYTVSRSSVDNPENWETSDVQLLTKKENYETIIETVDVDGEKVVLPKYNNRGEDFVYGVNEVNVPNDFESTVTSDGTIFTMINRLKSTDPTDTGTTDSGTIETTGTETTTETTDTGTTDSETPDTETSTADTGTSSSETTDTGITERPEETTTETSGIETTNTGSTTVETETTGTETSMTETTTSTETSTTEVPVLSTSGSNTKNPEKTLPKTNENHKNTALLSITGLLILALAGSIFLKKKH
jgi:LPXTG-motif cell wall-anchored protein